MKRGRLILALAVTAAAVAGYQLGAGGSPGAVLPGPSTAWAGTPVAVGDGETFVSADGGNAYLWQREGDRIVLLNHCMRVVDDEQAGQATFVSLPGIERGS